MNLRLIPAVITDVEKAIRFYLGVQTGLGARFRESFDATIETIRVRPLRYPLVLDDYRRALLRSFPYAIYFRIDKNEIYVVLVVHLARRPQLASALLRQRKMDS